MIKVSNEVVKSIVKSLIGLTLTEITKTTILVGQKYIWNLRLPTSTSHHTLRHILQSLVDWRNRGRRTRWKCQKPMLTFWLFFEIWLWTEILDQVLKPVCCYPCIYADSSNCGQKCELGQTWVKKGQCWNPSILAIINKVIPDKHLLPKSVIWHLHRALRPPIRKSTEDRDQWLKVWWDVKTGLEVPFDYQ